MHFFSPANVMKLLEVVRGEKTAKDVLATVDGARQDDQEDRRRLRRLRRLHRQPHDRAVLAPGRLPARGGRARRSRSTRRWRSSAWRWGRSAWATSPATTSAGRSASAATSRSPTCRYSKIADLLCELGRFGQKTGAGWYDYKPGKRDAIPTQGRDRDDREAPRASSASRRARSATRRSSTASSTRSSTRAPRSSRRASRCAPATSTWSTSPATASRCTAAGR